jgi:hypothetical protein
MTPKERKEQWIINRKCSLTQMTPREQYAFLAGWTYALEELLFRSRDEIEKTEQIKIMLGILYDLSTDLIDLQRWYKIKATSIHTIAQLLDDLFLGNDHARWLEEK